ncbi:hypothetical protein HG531_004182 [Fusarium graminearum]|nr:hypothetical protein HG531_004182 [Fusarium graminearum]
MCELAHQYRSNGAEVGRSLPEVILVVLETVAQGLQDPCPELSLLRVLQIHRCQNLNGILHNRASQSVTLGQTRIRPLDDLHKDRSESCVVQLVNHLQCLVVGTGVKSTESQKILLAKLALDTLLSSKIKDLCDNARQESSALGTLPVSIEGRENLLCLELLGHEVKAIDTAFSCVVFQVNFGRFIGDFQDAAFIKIFDSLGECAGQHWHNCILEYIHKRGEAQKSHDSKALLRLTQAMLTGDCCSGGHNSLDILLAVFLRNLVDACDCSVLVTHVGRLPDTGSKLRKECQQDSSGCRISVAFLFHSNLEGTENLLSQPHVRSVKQVLHSLDELSDGEQVEVVVESLTATTMECCVRLDSISQNKDVLKEGSVELPQP